MTAENLSGLSFDQLPDGAVLESWIVIKTQGAVGVQVLRNNAAVEVDDAIVRAVEKMCVYRTSQKLPDSMKDMFNDALKMIDQMFGPKKDQTETEPTRPDWVDEIIKNENP